MAFYQKTNREVSAHQPELAVDLRARSGRRSLPGSRANRDGHIDHVIVSNRNVLPVVPSDGDAALINLDNDTLIFRISCPAKPDTDTELSRFITGHGDFFAGGRSAEPNDAVAAWSPRT
jgi:hypothetical protein